MPISLSAACKQYAGREGGESMSRGNTHNIASAQAAGSRSGPVPGVGVQGKLLVVRDGAVLPDRCICCNAPASIRIVARFSRGADGRRPDAILQLIPYVGRIMWLVELIRRMTHWQYITIEYSICPDHKVQRWLLTVLAIACVPIGGGLFVLSFWDGGNPMRMAAGVVILLGVVAAILRPAQLAMAGWFTRGYGIRGAGAEFLASVEQSNPVRAGMGRRAPIRRSPGNLR